MRRKHVAIDSLAKRLARRPSAHLPISKTSSFTQYTKLDFKPQKGQLVLADFASLHASSRLPGSGARVSIDTTFHLKRRQSKDGKETIHPWRIEERAPHDMLLGLGQTHLFFFADDINQIVDSRGGFKHPTNLKILELETDEKN